MATKNDITGARLTTANKPMPESSWEALFERIRNTPNPRNFPDDDAVVHACEVCTKDFSGSINRKLCKFCGG